MTSGGVVQHAPLVTSTAENGPYRGWISVVVGVYNGGKDLRPSLDSVLGQRDVDIEVIVVDDGSTDETGAELRSMQDRDTRLRVLTQANAGLTSALIRGCGEARGEYIARHDIGDRSLPQRFRRQMALLEADPQAVMATCGYRFVGPESELLDEVMPRDTPGPWTEILRSGDEARLYGPHHGTVMFRRSAYEAAGGYRAEFYFAQDLDLWTRLAALGSLVYTREILYQVGFTHDSLSARYGDRQRRLRAIIAEATRRRVEGKPEADLLERAVTIRKPNGGGAAHSAGSAIDADYFIGSCLAKRHDPAARRYLGRVIRRRPFHAKAWVKLIGSYLAAAGRSS